MAAIRSVLGKSLPLNSSGKLCVYFVDVVARTVLPVENLGGTLDIANDEGTDTWFVPGQPVTAPRQQ